MRGTGVIDVLRDKFFKSRESHIVVQRYKC